MTGRVLSEEDVQMIDKHIHGVSEDEQQLVLNLIATIRDRDERLEKQSKLITSIQTTAQITVRKLKDENIILRKALERIEFQTCFGYEEKIDYPELVLKIAREALAKVSQKEVSAPDEPNRNAQTE